MIGREVAARDLTDPRRLSSRNELDLDEILKGSVQTVCPTLFCETCDTSNLLLYVFMYVAGEATASSSEWQKCSVIPPNTLKASTH